MVQIPQAELIPTQVRIDLLSEYVDLLLLHEPFRRELDALYEEREKYPFLPQLSYEDPVEDLAYSAAQGLMLCYFNFLLRKNLSSEEESRLFGDDSVEWQLYQFYKQAYAFCSRWELPAELWEHVLHLVRNVKSLEELRWWRESKPLPCVVSSRLPEDIPTPPKIPEYLPIDDTRESYLEKVQQIVNEYCEQIEQVWRAAGWRGAQPFSHYHNPQYLKRLAKQVFMRVVLGMGWGAICNALREEGVHVASRASIKRTTERAIVILQITKRRDSFLYFPHHPTIWQLKEDLDKRLRRLAYANP